MAAANPQPSEQIEVKTGMITYEFHVDDFMANQSHLAETLESRPFPAQTLPQWFVQVQPRGNAGRNEKFGVYLVLKTYQTAEVDYEIGFLNDAGILIRRLRYSYEKFTEGSGHGFFLSNNSNEPIPLSESGKLIVRVEIRETVENIIDTVRFPHRNLYNVAKSSITADFGKLFKTDEFADFIVESADGQEFPVHKAILAVRNPQFFANMFTAGLKEAREDRVKLPFDAEIVSSLLEYLYTDEVSNLTSIAAHIYPAAHQYQLNLLVDICTANISQNISANNISIAMDIAAQFGDVKLQSACTKFLVDNKGVAVRLLCEAKFGGNQAGQQGSAQPDRQ